MQAPPPSSRWKLAASPAHSLSTQPGRFQRGPGRRSGWLLGVFLGSRKKPLMMGAAWSIKNDDFFFSFFYIFLQLLGSSQVSRGGEHLEKLLQGGEVFFKKSSYGDGFHPPFPTIYLPIQPPHSLPWGDSLPSPSGIYRREK